jgi:hypothetical protein
MDPHDHRGKLRQLADDLAWLETHCQGQPALAVHAAHLRLAAALTRNVLGPAAEGQSARPLFVAVVGGAGTGKSTVVNFLIGTAVAEANPQAGYTRHPIDYLPAGESVPWPSSLGFLDPLQRVTQSRPGSADEDIYQVVRVPASTDGPNPLSNFVVWDCPDMTTWVSSGYISRLMEVVGLADVIVYVASDERYNDEVPTQFLHHLIRAGKAVVVCLTKAREEQVIALADHFQSEVLDRLPTSAGTIPPIPITSIPHLPPEVRNDPAGLGAAYRVPLLNQLLVLCPTPEEARARTVRNALRYLETAGEGLLDVVRRDLTELETWRNLVDAGRSQFEERYRQEFLAGESFRRFDRTREQVLEMLELTGPGKYVSAVLALLRLPYRYARDFLARVVVRPAMPSLSEHVVCSGAQTAWLDGLQAEALRRSGTHPIWKQITHGFDAGLKTQAHDWFNQVFRTFELKETDELDQAARALPERLANSPALLNTLRLGIVAFDLAAAGAVVWLTWPPSIYQLLLIPLAVSLSRQVVELAVRQVVDVGRNRLRAHRAGLVAEHLSQPLAKWLADWPVSGGSTMERLQLVLRRVPLTIRELSGLVPATAAPTAATPEPAAS